MGKLPIFCYLIFMKLHRFINELKLKKGNIKIENRELLNQLRTVLRLKAGEKIILCDGAMNEGVAEIKGYGKECVEVEILEITRNQSELERHVVLYCSILKKENFELVVQKATEVGVAEIVPIITERTVKLNLRKDRLEKIAKEAAEQSGRGVVPILHEPIDFKKAVETAKTSGTNLFFDQDGLEWTKLHSDEAEPRIVRFERTGAWVGPEGGWSSQELETAGNLDFKVISLGKTTLRAETAAIVGSFLVINNCNLQ